MIGHIARHGDIYFVVIHEGPDPATGMPFGRWHAAGASRGDAETLLADLMSDRSHRKELLLAMLDQRSDRLDKAAEEIGEFFDNLRRIGIRGLVADEAMDPGFLARPAHQSDTPDDSEGPTATSLDQSQGDAWAGTDNSSPDPDSTTRGVR